MLKFLRNKKTAKKVWIGLAVIIIPAFAFFGFGEATRSKKETAFVGKIFGHNISNLELKESLSATRTSAIIRFGDKLPEVEKYLNFQAQAWQRLILLYEAKKRKITVNDNEVIAAIQSAPQFRDKSGFNNKTYTQTLRYGFKLQPRIFEEQLRQNLMLAKLYNQVTKDTEITEVQVLQKYSEINQELNIHYIAGLFSDFAAKIKPDDKEIAAFFEKNKAMFKEPPVKDKPARIPELAEIKDKVKNTFIQEEAKKIAESKIKDCAEKLKKDNFKQAAKACGLKTGQTAFFKFNGEIENLGSGEMFWNTAKKLKNEELSNILSNEKGYFIIKLGEVKPTDEAKFAKEKQELVKRLISEKKAETFDKFAEELFKKAQQ